MKKTEQTNTSMNIELLKKVDEQAVGEGRSRSNMIEKMARVYLIIDKKD